MAIWLNSIWWKSAILETVKYLDDGDMRSVYTQDAKMMALALLLLLKFMDVGDMETFIGLFINSSTRW